MDETVRLVLTVLDDDLTKPGLISQKTIDKAQADVYNTGTETLIGADDETGISSNDKF
jgi:hypothetical protein